MKRQFRNWTLFGLPLIALLCVVLKAAFGVQTGQCRQLSDLPTFGKYFPASDIANLTYRNEQKVSRLFARTTCNAASFEKLAKDMDVFIVKYYDSDLSGMILQSPDEFTPATREIWVWAGRSPLKSGGRFSITLFYEPVETEDAGNVYIHIR